MTLRGDWRTERQYIELWKGTGEIVLPFTAGEVNLVMQPGPSGQATVTGAARWEACRRRARNRRRTSMAWRGSIGPGMIRLVVGAPRRQHVLTLVSSDPGLRAYVFTFGS
jgi:hypothetical protein